MDDLFSLADAGKIKYSTVLDFSMYLTEEYHVLPWEVAKSKFVPMLLLLTPTNDPYLADSFQVIYQSKRYKLLSNGTVIFTYM